MLEPLETMVPLDSLEALERMDNAERDNPDLLDPLDPPDLLDKTEHPDKTEPQDKLDPRGLLDPLERTEMPEPREPLASLEDPDFPDKTLPTAHALLAPALSSTRRRPRAATVVVSPRLSKDLQKRNESFSLHSVSIFCVKVKARQEQVEKARSLMLIWLAALIPRP